MEKWICSRDPEIMSGELCFTGTRVPVRNLFDSLESGESIQDFLEGFPTVERVQITALLEGYKQQILESLPACA